MMTENIKISIKRIKNQSIIMFLFSLLMILNVILQSDTFGLPQIILGGGFLGLTIYTFVQFMTSPDHFISFSDQEIKYCLREHKKPVSILRKNISNLDIELDVIHVTMVDGQRHSINIIEVHDYKKRMRIKDSFRAVENVT